MISMANEAVQAYKVTGLLCSSQYGVCDLSLCKKKETKKMMTRSRLLMSTPHFQTYMIKKYCRVEVTTASAKVTVSTKICTKMEWPVQNLFDSIKRNAGC